MTVTVDRAESQSMEDVIRGILEDLTEVPIQPIAEQVRQQLQEWADEGDDWAQDALDWASRIGIEKKIRQVAKREISYVTDDKGHAIAIPAYVDGARMSDEGEAIHQLALWWTLDWPTFEEMAAKNNAQRKVYNRRAVAYAQIRKLRQRFPETVTVGEACKLAGISDPKQFRLEATEAV